MRFSHAALVALTASVAYSQSVADLVSQIPSCALTCLATAATSAHCGFSDYACQCGPAKDAITKAATPCVTTSCTGNDPIKVLTISNQICAAVGGASSSASSVAKPAGSIAPSVAPSVAPTGGPGASPTTSAASYPTSSRPAQVSGNAGSRVQAGAANAGAAVLAALVL